MAFTFALKYSARQNAGTGTWSLFDGTSATFTVGAGNALIAVASSFDSLPLNLPTDSVTSDGAFVKAGVTWTSPAGLTGAITAGIAYKQNIAGGSHTITPPVVATGGGGDAILQIYEVTGLPPAIIVSSSNLFGISRAATSWTLNSANGTPGAGDLVVAVSTYENSLPLATTNVTETSGGYTALAVYQDATNNLPTYFGQKVTSAAGVVTAAWSATAEANKTDDVSAVVTFSPIFGPVISAQPQTNSAAVGVATSTSVTAAGSGSLSYRIQKRDAAGAWNNFGSASASAAFTSPVLSQAENGSAYRYQITDTAGTTISEIFYTFAQGLNTGRGRNALSARAYQMRSAGRGSLSLLHNPVPAGAAAAQRALMLSDFFGFTFPLAAAPGLAAAGLAQATGAAQLATQIQVASAGLVIASGAAAISTSIRAAAVGAGAATGAAALDAKVLFAAAGAGAASGTATLPAQAAQLAASGNAQAAGAAALLAQIQMAASGAGNAAGVAALTAGASTLAANGLAQATATADLLALIRFAATGGANASGAAAFSSETLLI